MYKNFPHKMQQEHRPLQGLREDTGNRETQDSAGKRQEAD